MNDAATILIGPDAFHEIGKILAHIIESGRWTFIYKLSNHIIFDSFRDSSRSLRVSKLQSFGLKESELQDLLPLIGVNESIIPYEKSIKFWSSGMCVALELKGNRIGDIMPSLVAELRQRFAHNEMEAAVRELDHFFRLWLNLSFYF